MNAPLFFIMNLRPVTWFLPNHFLHMTNIARKL